MTKKSKVIPRGFTIIEVSLALAIAGLIFVGVTVGITTNITRQRYFDASNDLVNYLRSAYSSVINTSNSRSTTESTTQVACSFNGQNALNNDSYAGRSDCAIYGRVLVFNNANDNRIRSYDLIGNTKEKISASDTLGALKEINADIINISKKANNSCIVGTSNPETYDPSWGTSLQTSRKSASASSPFSGVLLIVRSPVTGTVHTYYSQQTISNIDNILNSANNCTNAQSFYNSKKNESTYRPILELLKANRFSATSNVDICLNTPDLATIGRRRAIRINADGHNTSAVNLLDLDSTESRTICP